jgi:hypothetical protein
MSKIGGARRDDGEINDPSRSMLYYRAVSDQAAYPDTDAFWRDLP